MSEELETREREFDRKVGNPSSEDTAVARVEACLQRGCDWFWGSDGGLIPAADLRELVAAARERDDLRAEIAYLRANDGS